MSLERPRPGESPANGLAQGHRRRGQGPTYSYPVPYSPWRAQRPDPQPSDRHHEDDWCIHREEHHRRIKPRRDPGKIIDEMKCVVIDDQHFFLCVSSSAAPPTVYGRRRRIRSAVLSDPQSRIFVTQFSQFIVPKGSICIPRSGWSHSTEVFGGSGISSGLAPRKGLPASREAPRFRRRQDPLPREPEPLAYRLLVVHGIRPEGSDVPRALTGIGAVSSGRDDAAIVSTTYGERGASCNILPAE